MWYKTKVILLDLIYYKLHFFALIKQPEISFLQVWDKMLILSKTKILQIVFLMPIFFSVSVYLQNICFVD